MAIFNFEEAIYGALCYIYGEDDDTISAKEKDGFIPKFQERHYLSDETMRTISRRWSLDAEKFYWDVIDSLNACSFTEKLEAYRTICAVINHFSRNRDDRWVPAKKIRNELGISYQEYKAYIGK
jgi:hypothetical protein